ncbi:MAG TPA: GTPase-associated protein 1-related protein [Streptosporangiaceae bacterium]|nr:GTPase-associated protein 1-related protein [Streptosporangiaceae bacterium]
MTLLQLQYTSCENGLSGHSGFQFCAMTPGVPSEVAREVEQLTAYEPPGYLGAGEGRRGTDDHPVNLVYTFSEYGSAIIARVISAGLDFSNRSGNYFAHALVTDNPGNDLRLVLPVELWEAPFWEASQGPSTDLPPLRDLPSRGLVSAETTGQFLAGKPDQAAHLGSLLAAIDDAMGSGQQVLLIDTDSTAVCHWIAAACYLLGPRLARRLTFATYSHDPRHCPTHVVGTVAAVGPFRLDVAARFQAFDLAGGSVPEVPATQAASLLARAGVTDSAALWEMAASLGQLPDTSLAACFPVLASAALLLDRQLTGEEVAAAIGWLASPESRVTAEHKASAVRAALGRSLEQLPVQRQDELVELAVAADTTSAAAPGTLASEVECAIVAGVMARLDRGLSPGEVAGLRTDRARKAASDGCAERLAQADADRVAQLLEWALEGKLRLPGDLVERVGRDVIMPAVLDEGMPRGLARAATAWPALRAGMLDRLHTLPAPLRQATLAILGPGIFRTEDFARYPELGEEWIISVASRGQLSRAAAFERVVDLRRRQGRIPAADSHLLRQLWPAAPWTAEEASELVTRLPADELGTEPVRQECSRILNDFPRAAAAEEWMTFVTRLAGVPEEVLHEQGLSAALRLRPAISLIRQAVGVPQVPDAVLNQLIELQATGDPEVRRFLAGQLPPLLPGYPLLNYALSNCSADLLRQFCSYARAVLESGPGEVVLAARIFVIMSEFKEKNLGQQAAYLEHDVLRPVLPRWERRKIKQVGQQADLLATNASAELEWWLASQSTRRWLRLRGRAPF